MPSLDFSPCNSWESHSSCQLLGSPVGYGGFFCHLAHYLLLLMSSVFSVRCLWVCMGWTDAPEDSRLFFRCRCFLGAPVKKGRWEPRVVKPWRPSWAFWSPWGSRAALLGQSERRLPFSALSGLFALIEPIPSLGWTGVPGVETGTIVSYCQLLWDLLLFSWVLLFCPFWLHCHWGMKSSLGSSVPHG